MNIEDSYSLSGTEYSFDPSVKSHSDNDSVQSKKTKNKKEEIKAAIYTIKRKISPKKYQKINLFNTSLQINSSIINAVTGFPCINDDFKTYRVGSIHELLFFKVKFVSGECNTPCMTLFYDSPEQYERHMIKKLPQRLKQEHYERKKQFYLSKQKHM